jgi:putative transposase
VKYRFIEAHRDEFKVMVMCRVLQVSRSGYYDWVGRPMSDRAKANERLIVLIRASHTAIGGIYGARRVTADLKEAGEGCGKNCVARLMRVNGISGVTGYKVPKPLFGKPSILMPNRLQRQFTVVRPNEAWVTDITYIRTWQEWLYLAVVIDLFARNVVGWSMKPTLAKELVLDALLMAVWRRRPIEPVIVHSDQGTQYGSDAWYRFCVSHNLKPSMSRRGNCWDNAVAESFFSSLKKERVKKQVYNPRDQARADIFDYLEMFYNRVRRHSHLGDISPEAFEQASKCSGAVSV